MTVDGAPQQPDARAQPDPGDNVAGAGAPGPQPGHDPAMLAQEQAEMGGVIGTPLTRALRLGALLALLVGLGVWRGLPIIIVILAIVAIIFLHELGHYLAARWSHMKVTEFFIGFGPRIWSFRRGETEYGIKVIPAGAYVKIPGMTAMEELPPEDEARSYRQAPFHNRFAVAVAGSTMHFLIAFVLLVVQFAFIGHPDGDRWQIGNISPGSAAEAAGLRRGDELVTFDGRKVTSYDRFRSMIGAEPAGTVEVAVRRGGHVRTIPVTLSQRTRVIGTIGEDLELVDNGSELVVGAVLDDGQVAAAGLRPGQRVVALDGRPVTTAAGVADAIAAGARSGADSGSVSVTTESSGSTTVHTVDLGSSVATVAPAAFLGVGSRSVLRTDALPAAVVHSAGEFGRYVGVTVTGTARVLWPPNIARFLTSTVTGGAPTNTVDRPTPAASSASSSSERPVSIFGIVLLGSELTAESWSNIVGLLIGLNIMLGVLNLIPLLPFDGGHVAIAVYEKAQELRRRQTRRYLSDVTNMVRIAYPVIAVLGVLFLAATYLDLTKGVSL
ncbi:MAG: site-2 protease family protein [Actinobacteria bacterium]|nr:site-2 protease family protein [Actinomycetota bacterium]